MARIVEIELLLCSEREGGRSKVNLGVKFLETMLFFHVIALISCMPLKDKCCPETQC